MLKHIRISKNSESARYFADVTNNLMLCADEVDRLSHLKSDNLVLTISKTKVCDRSVGLEIDPDKDQKGSFINEEHYKYTCVMDRTFFIFYTIYRILKDMGGVGYLTVDEVKEVEDVA